MKRYLCWMILGALLTPILTAQVCAQTTLKLAHNASKGTPRAEAITMFAEEVKKRSDGRVLVEVNPGGAIQENLDVLLQLRTGKLDMSSYPHGTLASAIPEVDALGLPYAFLSSQQAWSALDGTLGDELAVRIEAHGMIVLGWMNNGGRYITNAKQPIQKPDDLRGLRIRTTADKSIMDMMTVLGAQVVPVGYGYLDDAMKVGYVDGQENSLNVIYQRKVHEVHKYIAVTNHRYSFAPMLIGRASWEKLSSADRKLLRSVAQEAVVLQRKLYDDAENRILETYRKMPDVTLTTPDPVAFRGAVKKVWDAWELKPFGAFVKKLRAIAGG